LCQAQQPAEVLTQLVGQMQRRVAAQLMPSVVGMFAAVTL
jgi:hypothetical protein